MSILRATVVINKKSGVPKDAARNVWHFSVPGGGEAGALEVAPALAAFYAAISGYYSPAVASAASAHRVEVAEVTSTGPGPDDDVLSSLLLTQAFTMSPAAASGTNVLPNEVAVALSFRGDVSGVPEESGITRPRSRRRGRVFLGPFATTVTDWAGPTNEPRVAATFREAVLDQYDALITALAAADAANRHVVYSRANNLGYNVESVSIDSEFDTIRRRGRKPQLRMTRAIAQGAAIASRDSTDVALAS